MALLQGESRARRSLCKGLLGSGICALCCPDVEWQAAFNQFVYGANRCSVCMDDIGPDNPRQLCGKTFCYNDE